MCESWVESAFNVNLNKVPGINFEPPEDPKEPVKVYLHCDFDDFQPDLMTDLHLRGGDSMSGLFQVYRMLPQQKILYFYSYNGIPFINNDQKGVRIDNFIVKDICKTLFGKGDVNDAHETESGTKLRYPGLEFQIPFTLEETNLLETQPLIGQIIHAQCRGGGESALSSVGSSERAADLQEDDEAQELSNVYSLVSKDYKIRV